MVRVAGELRASANGPTALPCYVATNLCTVVAEPEYLCNLHVAQWWRGVSQILNKIQSMRITRPMISCRTRVCIM